MEVDVKVLEGVAQNKLSVTRLEMAVKNGTLLNTCPFDGTGQDECNNVCRKVWPDLKGVCPCSKPHRLEIAQAIIALSKLVPEPKTYRVGDVFDYALGKDLLCIISQTGEAKYALMGLGTAASPNSGSMFSPRAQGIPLDALTDYPGDFRYLGHFAELSFKNGKVVTP